MGANRILEQNQKYPMIDIAVEDYGMLYRLALNGKTNHQSKCTI